MGSMKSQVQVNNQKVLHTADAKLFSSSHLSEQEMSLIYGGGQVAEAYAIAVACSGRSHHSFALHDGTNSLLSLV